MHLFSTVKKHSKLKQLSGVKDLNQIDFDTEAVWSKRVMAKKILKLIKTTLRHDFLMSKKRFENLKTRLLNAKTKDKSVTRLDF